jgi:hypothetical protein
MKQRILLLSNVSAESLKVSVFAGGLVNISNYLRSLAFAAEPDYNQLRGWLLSIPDDIPGSVPPPANAPVAHQPPPAHAFPVHAGGHVPAMPWDAPAAAPVMPWHPVPQHHHVPYGQQYPQQYPMYPPYQVCQERVHMSSGIGPNKACIGQPSGLFSADILQGDRLSQMGSAVGTLGPYRRGPM